MLGPPRAVVVPLGSFCGLEVVLSVFEGAFVLLGGCGGVLRPVAA